MTEKEILQHTAKIAVGRTSLWHFCQLKNPLFYTDAKTYLKELTDALQNLYEGKLIKENGQPFTKLMINMPPRFGKSRTLINFCQWMLGQDNSTRIIECSYNDNAAGDFSKYTRDGIDENKMEGQEYFIFSDFFPQTKIKFGSSSYQNWALEGQHFNYLGAGIMGSITGKGGNVLIIDDPIKLSEEAFNEDRLQKIWDWYTGTFLSRGDASGKEPLEIMTMTRWCELDPCGRILNSNESKDWYVIKFQAYDETTDTMLCESTLSKQRYLELRNKLMPEIFLANYHQITIDQKGRLYNTLKTYINVPMNGGTEPVFEQIKSYTDTADEGTDYLCSIIFGVYNGEAYVLDVYHTKDGMEITEPELAKRLREYKVNIARIESNNGGRGFARAVQRILWQPIKKEDGKEIIDKSIIIRWFHQSKNKRARIISNSAFIQEHIYFPINWQERWPEFHKTMITYLKDGKNKHDDAADAITGVSEELTKTGIEVLR